MKLVLHCGKTEADKATVFYIRSEGRLLGVIEDPNVYPRTGLLGLI